MPSAVLAPHQPQAFFRVLSLDPSRTTLFRGGALAELSAANPALMFQDLYLIGNLRLPLRTDVRLGARNLYICPSASITYERTDCDHASPPNLSIHATGIIDVQGPILLTGESGSSALSGAACNSCRGGRGGNIELVADELLLSSQVMADGGTGASQVYALQDTRYSYGCDGGAAGTILLAARNMAIKNATVLTRAGTGGAGYAFGTENRGKDGPSASLSLLSTGLLTIEGSDLSNNGEVRITATETAITSPIRYDTLDAAIRGVPDDTPPSISVLSPDIGAAISTTEPLEIRIRIVDTGTGVREITLTGLGIRETYPASVMHEGILTLPLDRIQPPLSLSVTAVDNSSHTNTVQIRPLTVSGPLSIPRGETLRMDGNLDLGNADLQVAGTIIFPRGTNVLLEAGSLFLFTSGLISGETPLSTDGMYLPNSLSIRLNTYAIIAGRIDCNGSSAPKLAGHTAGEDGGTLEIEAPTIFVLGAIAANGGDGSTAYNGNLQYTVGGRGGRGGTIKLTAPKELALAGTLAVAGGNSTDSVDHKYWARSCNAPGSGGEIFLSVGPASEVARGRYFDYPGRTEPGSACPGLTASWGMTHGQLLDDTGSTTPSTLDEIEPNDTPEEASRLIFLPAHASGRIRAGDNDWYRFGQTEAGFMAIEISVGTGVEVTLELQRADLASAKVTLHCPADSPNRRIRELVWLAPGTFHALIRGTSGEADSTYGLSVGPPSE